MVTAQSLQQQVASKVSEVKSLVEGINDDQASMKPAEGEWCAKEVLSHLIGEELGGAKVILQRFLEEDTLQIDIEPGNPYFENRSSMSTADLLSTFESEYGKIGEFLGSLSEEQLNRTAKVPLLKETPLGDNPTLAQFAGALMNFHVNDHVEQLRNLCH